MSPPERKATVGASTDGLANDARSARRNPVRALVVDDDRAAAQALRRALEAGGARAEVAGATDGLTLAGKLAPDVIFVDAGVPIVRSIAALELDIRTIVLAHAGDSDDAVAAIRDGARGYLGKEDVIGCDLPRLIDAAMADELVCPRSLLSAIVARLARLPAPAVSVRTGRRLLTAREWEVLELLFAGRSTHWIADHLVISVETVRTHVKNLMRKLGVRSRRELLAATARLRSETARVVDRRVVGRGPDELLAG